jgi:hypothetical protein
MKEGQDAMTRFGFGIVSYFQLLNKFLLYFVVLSILYSPVLINYMRYRNSPNAPPKKLFENMQMGNLGASFTNCVTYRANRSDIVFGCENGNISEFVSLGVY